MENLCLFRRALLLSALSGCLALSFGCSGSSSTAEGTMDSAGSGGTNQGGSSADADDVTSDPNNYFRATFVLVDGTTETIDVKSRVLYTGYTGICGSVERGWDYGGDIFWEIADPPAPMTYSVEEPSAPMMHFLWPRPDGNGVLGASGQGGTLTITQFGTSPGDVIEGTFDDLELDADRGVRAVEDGEFRCVIP